MRDDLPTVTPHARIFIYEYDSTVVFSNDKSTFVEKASDLLERLRVRRSDDQYRPLIFLGHSLGGLLIKQALAIGKNNPMYFEIRKSTQVKPSR